MALETSIVRQLVNKAKRRTLTYDNIFLIITNY